ncbi:MAG: hypothetical protein PCFJNLEI_03120 [Verrucomicrobiae bacterium]|nr:hypothetical protein [Verrucomicrobiae bacterium]
MLLLLITPAWAVDYNGVSFSVEPAWSVSVLQGTIQPVRYQLENRGPAQSIQVVFNQNGGVQVTRTHRLDSGERVTGWFYVPMAKGSWNNYGQVYFRASKSGALPRERWQGVSFGMNYNFDQKNIPRLLLVGQQFDLTGLQDAVEARVGSSGRGNSQGAFARVGATAVPPSWLGLAGLSAVWLEQSAAEQLSPDSKNALADYVASGGTLLLISADTAWCSQWWGNRGTLANGDPGIEITYGLGTIKQLPRSPTGAAAWERWLAELNRPAGLVAAQDLAEQFLARPDFPRVSYMALWWLMAAFAIIVGPVNYGVLRKRGRLPWFIITAPAISIAFGLILLLFFVGVEGRQAKAVVGGLTYLFQRDHQAVTCQRLSVYATSSLPLQYPSGTLVWDKFGKEFGNDFNPAYGRRQLMQDTGASIDCTTGWQLGEGYLPPRLLRAFGSLQPRTERGRALVELRGDQWHVQNGLGVNLRGFLYRDTSGKLFSTGTVRNGETARLEPFRGSLHEWHVANDAWWTLGSHPTTNAYIAVTNEPFGFEKPHPRLTVKPTPHTIFGFL